MNEQKLLDLIADLFRIEKDAISDTISMEDLEIWDSLKHMELVTAIEEELGIELSFEQITEMVTVADIKRVLSSY